MSDEFEDEQRPFDGTVIVDGAMQILNIYSKSMGALGFGDYETLPIMKALIDQGINNCMSQMSRDDQRRFKHNCREAAKAIQKMVKVHEHPLEEADEQTTKH